MVILLFYHVFLMSCFSIVTKVIIRILQNKFLHCPTSIYLFCLIHCKLFLKEPFGILLIALDKQ